MDNVIEIIEDIIKTKCTATIEVCGETITIGNGDDIASMMNKIVDAMNPVDPMDSVMEITAPHVPSFEFTYPNCEGSKRKGGKRRMKKEWDK